MVVGIHAASAERFLARPTGVEHATHELLRAIAALPDASPHRFFLYTNPAATRFLPTASAYQVRILRSPMLWTQFRLSMEMLLHPPDVLFVPSQALPRALPRRAVATIHGIEFEQYPNSYSPRERRRLALITRDACRRASHIIAVSHATKMEAMTRYGVPQNRISVIYHGAPTPPEHEGPRATAGTPYFLFIGRIEVKKNIDGIVRAFDLFRSRNPERDHGLILAGKPGFGSEEIYETARKSSFSSDIQFPGYVSETRKWDLLFGATALVFPSWAEGFGLPILEAQAAGTPVITSNTSAMPEIAGSRGALFVTPGNDEELSVAMQRLVADEGSRQELIQNGKANLARFSWEETARKTLRVLLNQ